MVSSHVLSFKISGRFSIEYLLVDVVSLIKAACKVLLAYRPLLRMLHLVGSKTLRLRQKRVVDFIVNACWQLLW